jgi:hypothetical protein
MAAKYTKLRQNRPNGHAMYHHLPLQEPPIFTQIGIFGLKLNHLATLIKWLHVWLPGRLPSYLGCHLRKKAEVAATQQHSEKWQKG